MENKMLKLMLILILTGCGNYEAYDWKIYHKPYIPPGNISSDMQQHIDTFNQAGQIRGINTSYSKLVSINWQDTLNLNGQELLGHTQVYQEPEGQLVSTITFSKLLLTYPDTIQNLTITHELGHALLGVKHTARNTNDLQIMYWAVGQDMIDNVPNYNDPIQWSKYLDFMFEQQNQEVYQ